jgi:hypothetical protein
MEVVVATGGEYRDKTEMMIMGDDRRPFYGYKPIDIKNRVEDLLRKEKRLKEVGPKYKGVLKNILKLIVKYQKCVEMLDNEPDLDGDCCHDTEKEVYETFIKELGSLG